MACAPRHLFAVVLLAACSDDVQTTDASSEQVSAEMDTLEGCQSVRRYDGRPKDLTCRTVTAPNGVWNARRLVTDAPEGLCAYTFNGRAGQGPSEDDTKALNAVAVVAANCGRVPPVAVSLKSIPIFEDPSLVGTTGCDVCGIVMPERTWVLIPPERSALKRVELRLASGSTRAFELVGVSQTSTVVHFALPPAPEGDHWLPGVVRSN